MFYGYLILLLIIIKTNIYYNQLDIDIIKLKNQLEIKNSIINDLNIQLEYAKIINNGLKLQLEQKYNNYIDIHLKK